MELKNKSVYVTAAILGAALMVGTIVAIPMETASALLDSTSTSSSTSNNNNANTNTNTNTATSSSSSTSSSSVTITIGLTP
jgi:cytoskeletal protein RodZ